MSLFTNWGNADVGGRNEGDALMRRAEFECSYERHTERIGMHKLHGDYRASQNTVDRLYQCHIFLENYFH